MTRGSTSAEGLAGTPEVIGQPCDSSTIMQENPIVLLPTSKNGGVGVALVEICNVK